MKIKDIKAEDKSLDGIRVKTPKGVVGIWKSQWNRGVWLNDGKSGVAYPQFINDLRDCLEWEVTEEEINCDKLISLEYIDNTSKTTDIVTSDPL